MRALHRRVLSYDVARWAESFLGALAEASAQSRPTTVAMTAPGELARTVATLRAAAALLVLLDYDGTLVPFAAVPELAAPDGALLALLARLAARPRTTVHVMSGRIRDTLERREERARMGTTGREGVREQYLITRNLRRWLFFLHALGRPGERVITVS
jgi:trehalose 6-phosphate synthase/phosphatase